METILYVLSFVTLTDKIRYYAGGNGELSNGEQTEDVKKAVKFKTSKEAEKVNKTLDAYYYKHRITQINEHLYII